MIKQILFDCGGVLVELNFRKLMEEISGSVQTAQDFIQKLWHPDSPWLRYDSGDLNTQQVMVELKAYMPREYHHYMQQFVERWLEALPPMEGMEQLVAQIREQGYPCYLLSNFSEGFAQMPARTPVLQQLDGMVISYQIHMLKPDPEIFHYTARHFGIDPAQTLFVDDNLHNVEAARAVGMEAYQFTTPQAFADYLKDRGILEAV